MQCRACGTVIADKAIVCFRCGAPTLERTPAVQPSAGRRNGGAWQPIVAGAIVGALGAGFAFAFVDGAAARAGAAAGAIVLAVAIWRLLAGRRAARRRSGVH